jgi:hypothetical protein
VTAINGRADWYKVPTEIKKTLPGGVVVRRPVDQDAGQQKPIWWTGKKED